MSWQETARRMVGTCTRIFGEQVTYLPRAGGSITLLGVFNDAWQEVDPDSGAVISSNRPVIGIRLADLSAAPTAGDRVRVRGIEYLVKDSQRDGEAGAILMLQKD